MCTLPVLAETNIRSKILVLEHFFRRTFFHPRERRTRELMRFRWGLLRTAIYKLSIVKTKWNSPKCARRRIHTDSDNRRAESACWTDSHPLTRSDWRVCASRCKRMPNGVSSDFSLSATNKRPLKGLKQWMNPFVLFLTFLSSGDEKCSSVELFRCNSGVEWVLWMAQTVESSRCRMICLHGGEEWDNFDRELCDNSSAHDVFLSRINRK